MQCHVERELSADSIDLLFNIIDKKSVHSMKSVSFDQHDPQLARGRENLLTLERGNDLTDSAPIMKTCTLLCKSLREKLRIAHENEDILSTAPSIKVAKLLPTTKSTVRDSMELTEKLTPKDSLDFICF